MNLVGFRIRATRSRGSCFALMGNASLSLLLDRASAAIAADEDAYRAVAFFILRKPTTRQPEPTP